MRSAHDAGAASTLRTRGRDGRPCTIRRTGVLNGYWLATVLGDGARLGAGSHLDVAFGADVPDDAIAGAVLRLLALSARGVEVSITRTVPPGDTTESAVLRWHSRTAASASRPRVAHG